LLFHHLTALVKCGEGQRKAWLKHPRTTDKEEEKGGLSHNNIPGVWNACEARGCRRKPDYLALNYLSCASMEPVHLDPFRDVIVCGIRADDEVDLTGQQGGAKFEVVA
jgi:hypothetical protein